MKKSPRPKTLPRNLGGRPLALDTRIPEIVVAAMHGCSERHARRLLRSGTAQLPEWPVVQLMLVAAKECANSGEGQAVLKTLKTAMGKIYGPG